MKNIATENWHKNWYKSSSAIILIKRKFFLRDAFAFPSPPTENMSASQSRGGRFASRPGARSLAPGGYYCGWVPRWLRTKLSQVGTSWHTMFEELVGTCRAPLIGKVRARLCFAYLTLSYVIPVTLTQKVADVVLHPSFTLLSLVVFLERADKPGELYFLLLLRSLQCFLWIYQISASWCYRYVLSLAPPEALDSWVPASSLRDQFLSS